MSQNIENKISYGKGFIKKIKDLKIKEKEISKIKNNLQEFTNSLEEMDFIKKAKESKKNY